jgi:hypothetical protein
MRPRFDLELPYGPAELQRRLETGPGGEGSPCTVVALEGHFQIEVAEPQRHFWSPQLSLQAEAGPRGGTTRLHGLYGPSAAVWTMFMAAYAFLGFGALFLLMLGGSQALIGATPWGLWAGGAATVAMVLPYLGSLVGQSLAAEHMQLLRCYLHASLGLEHEASESACRFSSSL